MTPEELRKLISQPEGPKLDFKRKYDLRRPTATVGADRQKWDDLVKGQWDEFIKDILALANGNVMTARQPGRLIIGVDDNLQPDGTRQLHDVSNLELTSKQILDKINSSCNPPIEDIECEQIELGEKKLYVVTIPPSPYVHETIRRLQPRKGDFNAAGQLANIRGGTPYAEHTVFIRIGESIRPATQAQCRALAVAKSRETVFLPPILSTPPALHQLPADLPDFTGREEEIAAIEQALPSTDRVLIVGMGGVGKSALAIHIAHRVKDYFPDAQLYLDLRGTSDSPLSPAEALTTLLHAFYPAEKLPRGEAELATLFRTTLHSKRALILLDNAADEAQVKALLPGEPNCVVLITSRRTFALPGLQRIDLDTFGLDESRALLLSICPRLSLAPPTRFSESGEMLEVGVVDQIAELCGHLPLALRAAGSLLAVTDDLDPDAYVVQLRDERTRLERIGTEGVNVSLEASFNLSYERLGEEAARVFRMLAVFAGSFYKGAAEVVCEDAGSRHLSELRRHRLVEWDSETTRYWLHDLVRLFADARLQAAERAIAQQRHARHYANVVSWADARRSKGGGALKQGLALFDLEWHNIQAGQAWAAAYYKENDMAAELCSNYPVAGAHLLDLRQHPRERIPWLRAALAAARRLGDRQAVGTLLGDLGQVYMHLDNPHRAINCHRQHLSIAREVGDRHGEGVALSNLGNTYRTLGDFSHAVECHEQHLAIAREVGDRRGEGVALNNLGNAYRDLGETHRAIEFYKQDLAIAHETGDLSGKRIALDNLGRTYAHLGETHLAIEFHRESLTIAQELGDRRGEGTTFNNLGRAYADLGENNQAIEFYEQALAIFDEIDDRAEEAEVLMNIGNAYDSLGKSHHAIEFNEQALAIFREIGDQGGEASALTNLSMAYVAIGEGHRAVESCKQALVIFRETSNRHGEGAALGNLGVSYTAIGEFHRAIELHEQSLVIFREISARRDEGEALWHMSRAFAKLGDFAQAIAQAEAALEIWEPIKDFRTDKVREQLAEWRGQVSNE